MFVTANVDMRPSRKLKVARSIRSILSSHLNISKEEYKQSPSKDHVYHTLLTLKTLMEKLERNR